ncbi:MAG: DUF2852 domain-containing protein [Rhodobacteraceae bacterium]|nr:DUF2852 domain-containing protein [Paracoccaceae bacterium]
MSPTTTAAAPGWFTQAERWLDDRGKGAWIALMVVSFIVFWPLGLAVLAYMIWSKRMFSKSCRRHRDDEYRVDVRLNRHRFRTSGNTAFDAYKADTLERLEREQDDFESFLKRLRDSKDKAEFDAYMEERARAARDVPRDDQAAPRAEA